jgi:hypothetical protein
MRTWGHDKFEEVRAGRRLCPGCFLALPGLSAHGCCRCSDGKSVPRWRNHAIRPSTSRARPCGEGAAGAIRAVGATRRRRLARPPTRRRRRPRRWRNRSPLASGARCASHAFSCTDRHPGGKPPPLLPASKPTRKKRPGRRTSRRRRKRRRTGPRRPRRLQRRPSKQRPMKMSEDACVQTHT